MKYKEMELEDLTKLTDEYSMEALGAYLNFCKKIQPTMEFNLDEMKMILHEETPLRALEIMDKTIYDVIDLDIFRQNAKVTLDDYANYEIEYSEYEILAEDMRNEYSGYSDDYNGYQDENVGYSDEVELLLENYGDVNIIDYLDDHQLKRYLAMAEIPLELDEPELVDAILSHFRYDEGETTTILTVVDSNVKKIVFLL